MLFRRQTTVCREGWLYLAIVAIVFGGAMFKEVNLLLILAGMLLGPALLNWQAVATNLRGLGAVRKLPLGLSAGDRLSVGVILTNARRHISSWGVEVQDQIRRVSTSNRDNRRQAAPLRPQILFPYVPANQSRKGGYRGRLLERGRYEFGPLRLTTRFPFGLFSKTITLAESETLVVLPRLGRLTEGWTARRLDAFSGADRRRRRPGPEGDFYGVREWRTGDNRRLIHWRSSARLGKLVVRQLERPHSRDAAVVLDLWQPAQPAAEHVENVELAVSFAASVLADLCRKGGSNVQLAVDDSGPECLGGPASPAFLQGLLERLATVEAQPRDTLPAALLHALPQIPVGAEIIVVTTRPVDLTDADRFAALRSDHKLSERLRNIRCVDASNEQLAVYYSPNP